MRQEPIESFIHGATRRDSARRGPAERERATQARQDRICACRHGRDVPQIALKLGHGMVFGEDLQEGEYLLVLLARYRQAVVPHARARPPTRCCRMVGNWLQIGSVASAPLVTPLASRPLARASPPRGPVAMDKPQLSFHQAVYKNEIEAVRTMLQRDPKRARLTAHHLYPTLSLYPSLCLHHDAKQTSARSG